MSEKREKAEQFLRDRQGAYRAVFVADSPNTHKVLADLAKFCRARESTFHIDSRIHALQEGRREVWLRIASHLEMTDEQLYKLVTGETI